MRTRIIEAIEQLCDSELITLWNEYCDANQNGNQIFINNDDFVETCLSSLSASEIISICDKGYSSKHEYVYNHDVDGWTSFDDLEDVIYHSDVADWIVSCNGISTVIDISDFEDEEEEEEE